MARLTDARKRARELYYQGLTHDEIARVLNANPVTVRQWKSRDKWDQAQVCEVVPAEVTALEPELRSKDFAAALKKIEPLLDVEDVLKRHKKTAAALQSVVVVIAAECQRRSTNYRANPEHADWEGLAKLTNAAITMNAQCLNQEVFIHQAVADRASAIAQHLSQDELDAI